MYEGGIAKQRWSVSDTAEYGDYVSGPRVIDAHVKENMKAVLADVQSGAFAQRFIDDQDAGGVEFAQLRKQGEQHPIEEVGHQLRDLMSWVKSHDDDYVEGTAAADSSVVALPAVCLVVVFVLGRQGFERLVLRAAANFRPVRGFRDR